MTPCCPTRSCALQCRDLTNHAVLARTLEPEDQLRDSCAPDYQNLTNFTPGVLGDLPVDLA
jgi:hypothetical protein